MFYIFTSSTNLQSTKVTINFHCMHLFLWSITSCLIQVFDLFDEKQNGVIEFEEFVHVLGVFHPAASITEKIECEYFRKFVCFLFCLLFKDEKLVDI